MTAEECKQMGPGDRIKAANGQTGVVLLNNERTITVQFDNGPSVTGSHKTAWMIEQVSSCIRA